MTLHPKILMFSLLLSAGAFAQGNTNPTPVKTVATVKKPDVAAICPGLSTECAGKNDPFAVDADKSVVSM
jgi:hypothetical protein